MTDDDRDRIAREDDDLRDAWVLLDDGEARLALAPCCNRFICACDPDRDFMKAHPLRRLFGSKRWQS